MIQVVRRLIQVIWTIELILFLRKKPGGGGDKFFSLFKDEDDAPVACRDNWVKWGDVPGYRTFLSMNIADKVKQVAPLQEGKTPKEIFKLFVIDELIMKMVE
jgi:hypothetical protein